jgi:hypothetical protein
MRMLTYSRVWRSVNRAPRSSCLREKMGQLVLAGGQLTSSREFRAMVVTHSLTSSWVIVSTQICRSENLPVCEPTVKVGVSPWRMLAWWNMYL